MTPLPAVSRRLPSHRLLDLIIAAYAGALVSYSIVVSKSLGMPQLNRAYLLKAMMEDNAQYGFMAVYWFLSKPLYRESGSDGYMKTAHDSLADV